MINFSFKTVIVDKRSLYFLPKNRLKSSCFFTPPHSSVEIIRAAKKHSTNNLKGAGPNITLDTHTHQRMHTCAHRHTHTSLPLITHKIFRWFMGLQVLFCKEQLVIYLLIQNLLFLSTNQAVVQKRKKKIKANWCWLRPYSKSFKLEAGGKNICQTELGKRPRHRRMKHSSQDAKNLSSTS